MTRISRISTPRATLFAIALITVVMLTFGAFSAEEGARAGVGTLAGEPETTSGECQPPLVPPCPPAPARRDTHAATGGPQLKR